MRLLLAFVAVLGVACGKTPVPGIAWEPGQSYATIEQPVYRGLLDRRGLIHAHNIHSHDACDGAPTDASGAPNAQCLADFRGDLCQAAIDFAFMTDHGAMFDTTEYPDTMLLDASLGDRLVVRHQQPVANRVSCPGGRSVLLVPGNEGNNLMPVGLESHVGDAAARQQIYGVSTDPGSFPANTAAVTAAIDADHAHGAVVLVAHPEGLSREELATFPIDGFEMYNLHANALFTDHGLAEVATLITSLGNGGTANLPANPNTVFLGIFDEDPRYLSRWAYVLSQGQKRVTTLGSDCHQNAIPPVMSDGQRGDRYRRVMQWFSNHLLVKPNADGSWDDVNLKEALRSGRLYGAFEALGYPDGFDYHATAGAQVTEMGGEVALSTSPTLSVTAPALHLPNPSRKPPAITVRLLRADASGWVEVSKGPGNLSYVPTQPGAYRAEVRMVPHHLEPELGPVAASWLSHDAVWIYSNPVYVR